MLCAVRWFQARSAIPKFTYREATTLYLIACVSGILWLKRGQRSLI